MLRSRPLSFSVPFAALPLAFGCHVAKVFNCSYVVNAKVLVAGKQRRTTTVEGKKYKDRGAPWWNSGAGEALKWRVKGMKLPAKVEVTAMDEDQSSADDHIGTGHVYISPKIGSDLAGDLDYTLDAWSEGRWAPSLSFHRPPQCPLTALPSVLSPPSPVSYHRPPQCPLTALPSVLSPPWGVSYHRPPQCPITALPPPFHFHLTALPTSLPPPGVTSGPTPGS